MHEEQQHHSRDKAQDRIDDERDPIPRQDHTTDIKRGVAVLIIQIRPDKGPDHIPSAKRGGEHTEEAPTRGRRRKIGSKRPHCRHLDVKS